MTNTKCEACEGRGWEHIPERGCIVKCVTCRVFPSDLVAVRHVAHLARAHGALEDALEFYANDDNYEIDLQQSCGTTTETHSKVQQDLGECAQAALAAARKDQPR